MRNPAINVTSAAALLLASCCSNAGPLLTEIHYNGPAGGSDPDEFLELSNPGAQVIDLSGWRFSEGVDFDFGAGISLAPGDSLVIARTPGGFLETFAGFSGQLFDFAGALSNGGETLSLNNPDGEAVWSVRYDDALPWPVEADGLGSSLHLSSIASDPTLAASWTAAAPTPGIWRGAPDPEIALPAPQSLLLIASGLLIARVRRSRFGGQFPTATSEHNALQGGP